MKRSNMLRIVPAAVLAGLTSYAHAQADPFCGFYVGGSLGGTTTSANLGQSTTAGILTGGGMTLDLDQLLRLDGPESLKTDNTLKGALFAGYGQNWNRWYLGAEIFIDLARYKNHTSVALNGIIDSFEDDAGFTLQTRTQAKLSDFQGGIDLRPGYLLTPQSMLYGRVGVAFSHLKLNTHSSLTGFDIVDEETWSLNAATDESKNRGALRLGAGLEQNICPCLNLRFDYIYAYYGKKSVGVGPVSEVIGTGVELGSVTFAAASSARVYNNTVMLGLTYLMQ